MIAVPESAPRQWPWARQSKRNGTLAGLVLTARQRLEELIEASVGFGPTPCRVMPYAAVGGESYKEDKNVGIFAQSGRPAVAISPTYVKSESLMGDVETSVLEVLEGVVQTDEVRKNPDLPLFESGLLDSIGVVQMLAALSQKCGVEIPLTDFDASTWDTPAHIVENVRDRLSS